VEIESLFSSTRWEILKELSVEQLSPMELAEKIKTTSANISQQLRLLELAGLVKSERTSNVDRGKPRVVYSIAGNNAYLIIASHRMANKKLLSLTKYQNFMIKSFFLGNTEHHAVVAEIYTKLKDKLHKIQLIGAKSAAKLELHVVLKDPKDKLSLNISNVKLNLTKPGQIEPGLIILYREGENNE
jgi:predicted transcriptional regulator